jgi:hypothetical protein
LLALNGDAAVPLFRTSSNIFCARNASVYPTIGTKTLPAGTTPQYTVPFFVESALISNPTPWTDVIDNAPIGGVSSRVVKSNRVGDGDAFGASPLLSLVTKYAE